jgi:organic hydroperoxide reductase OsmC/OhrA
MAHPHHYTAQLHWDGAADGPAVDYARYSRRFRAEIPGKPVFLGSADAAFKGDKTLFNPEDLLLIALASCHMLSYLAVTSRKGLVVTAYEDQATGTMMVERGAGRFTEVVLRPTVTVAAGTDTALALALHRDAQDGCFIAASVNFPVSHEARILLADLPGRR